MSSNTVYLVMKIVEYRPSLPDCTSGGKVDITTEEHSLRAS